MANQPIIAPARYTVRLLGRSVFAMLFTLALAVSVVSFLSACECVDRFFLNAYYPNKTPDNDNKITFGSDLPTPAMPPVNEKKDN
jgi:hypothetical protein